MTNDEIIRAIATYDKYYYPEHEEEDVECDIEDVKKILDTAYELGYALVSIIK